MFHMTKSIMQKKIEWEAGMKKFFDLLGLVGMDRVTGIKGVIESLDFDLYGCVQVLINQGADESGKMKEKYWMDVRRIKILDANPVMEQPNFEYEYQADVKQGAAGKPIP